MSSSLVSLISPPEFAEATVSRWEIWDRRECVGRSSTLVDARRGCRNDEGRTLTIFDPQGRIAARYRDGRELVNEDA